MLTLPDMSVWVPVLWDNLNNLDIVWIEGKSYHFPRYSFNTQQFPNWSFQWARLKDVQDALEEAR